MMRKSAFRLILMASVMLGFAAAAHAAEPQLVVLLHGLAREPSSMEKLAVALAEQGFEVCNVGYPSTEYPIEQLTRESVLPAVERCIGETPRPVNFVTHSMGGILVRQLRADAPQLEIGRVVMLGPPNQGSEIVDKLAGLDPLHLIATPAGLQLGTTPDAVPVALGPIDFETGIIAGTRTISPILSAFILSGDDDGTVSVASAKIEGMRDFLLVPAVHPFLMNHKQTIHQTIHFLEYGSFAHPNQQLAQGTTNSPNNRP